MERYSPRWYDVQTLVLRIVTDCCGQASGFSDIVPLVREQSVKAVLTIIPKLYDRTINGALLKLLAKTSNDEQPGIRTNTTVCLGKIAKNLGAGVSSNRIIQRIRGRLADND